MPVTTVAPPKVVRSWTFSIGLFTIATVGEFVALAGWYVLHHANAPIGSGFYQPDDDLVAWLRADEPRFAFLRDLLAPAGEFLQSPHVILAILVLWAGFAVERAMVVIWLRVPRRVITPEGHLRPRLLVIGGVTLAEIIVWLVWVRTSEAGEPLYALAILAIGIHLVHAYEVALIKHKAFPPLLKDRGVLFITALEACGGTLALFFARRGWVLRPLAIMAAALLTEHIAQVAALKADAKDGR